MTWIAEGSPYYLLEASYDHIETTIGDVQLMKACDPNPIETVGTGKDGDDGIVWGPSGHFLYRRGSEGWVVRRVERARPRLTTSAG